MSERHGLRYYKANQNYPIFRNFAVVHQSKSSILTPMLHTYYFSASNTTEKIARAIADNLSSEVSHHNITSPRVEAIAAPGKEDVALFAAPVYAGRIPAIAAERFRKIKGEGQKCVVIVVYGNRDYDDALVELCDLATENGFNVIAAAAFVAQHSIFPKVAATRPDADDLIKIAELSTMVRELLDTERMLDINAVKGNRPYKDSAAIPLIPAVSKGRCRECGTCFRECPAGAISKDNFHITDAEKCISCSRCITVCPDNARYFGGLKYRLIAPIFRKKCAERREPEWFIPE